MDLHSLLYADDVVLVADSPEKLQELIAVVDQFCRRWHMDINLKKSEVMVVGTHGCTHCTHTLETHNWLLPLVLLTLAL